MGDLFYLSRTIIHNFYSSHRRSNFIKVYIVFQWSNGLVHNYIFLSFSFNLVYAKKRFNLKEEILKIFLNRVYKIEKIGKHSNLFKHRKKYEGKTVKLLTLDIPGKQHVSNYGKRFEGFIGCDVVILPENQLLSIYQVKLSPLS